MYYKTKLINLAWVIFGALLFALPITAQTPQQRHERLKLTLASGDLKMALIELNSLRGVSPVTFAANNYDYLSGRLQERTGETAEALANYQAVVARNSLLSQYALWRLARIARSTGDLTLERERLRQMVAIAPTSLLREAAILRLGQSFFESKDFLAAVAALRPLGESKNKSDARAAQVLIAESLLASGQRDEARAVFTKLVALMPDASRPDDFALAAVRGLDELDAGNDTPSATKPALPESEHLMRAAVYQFNRDFDAARRHYLAIAQRYPQSPTLANALYQTGRGFYLHLKYDDALKYFQQVLERFPDSMSARDALSFSAGTYNRLKRTDDAVAAYRLFIERFPDAPNPERPYLNIIDALHEVGRHQEALDWVNQTRTQFKGQVGEGLALFAQTRIHLAQGSWQTVVADTNELRQISELGGNRVPGGTTLAELTFLRAYALEQLGRTGEAVTEYLSLPDGRNEYYGQRATQRLLALSGDTKSRALIEGRARALRTDAESALTAGQTEQGRRTAQTALRLTTDPGPQEELRTLVRDAYEKLPAYRFPLFKTVPLGRQVVFDRGTEGDNRELSHRAVAEELLFLGLYDEGVLEFAAGRSEGLAGAQDHANSKGTTAVAKPLRPSASPPIDLDYTLAIYALRGDLANRAVRFGEQVWKPIPADYVLEVAPREMIDLLYPVPYRESLLKHSAQRAIDPRFVISIARQESRFQPDAKSVSAARGLTQFIAETANQIAHQLGVRDFTQDELYNPDTAILFGTQYLANLFQQFPAQPQAVAASYNGGPENVARWLVRSRSKEPDRYVTELGFSQTKDYVFKVMTNVWVYQELYNERLERK
ncbi:MAG: transglycosylase SLT domain-containing protein [Pyrinomonadaceae bacterium]